MPLIDRYKATTLLLCKGDYPGDRIALVVARYFDKSLGETLYQAAYDADEVMDTFGRPSVEQYTMLLFSGHLTCAGFKFLEEMEDKT